MTQKYVKSKHYSSEWNLTSKVESVLVEKVALHTFFSFDHKLYFLTLYYDNQFYKCAEI